MRVEAFAIEKYDAALGLESPFLTVIVPVYNEERTIDAILTRLIKGPYPFPEKEIVVVDDGSTDQTAKLLEKWRDTPGLNQMRHSRNRGKGAAIRTGLEIARGVVTIIQDADLEYDPADIPKVVEVIRRGRSLVVYGSRYQSTELRQPWTRFRLGVMVLNWTVWVLYGKYLTDEATCYKAFRTDVLRHMNLQCNRFEFCPEVTAKTIRLKIPIVEVPIGYNNRSTSEGKKIGWRDSVEAAWTLIRWRFAPIR